MKVERIEAFDDTINSCWDSVTVCGIEFSPADILAKLDPIAYNCYAGDYMAEIETEEEE